MFLKSYSHYSSFLWGSPSLMEPHLSQQHVPRPQICCLSTITGGIQVRVYLYHHRYLRNYYWRVKVTYYLLVLWLIKRLPAYNTYLPTTTRTYLLQPVPTFYNTYLLLIFESKYFVATYLSSDLDRHKTLFITKDAKIADADAAALYGKWSLTPHRIRSFFRFSHLRRQFAEPTAGPIDKLFANI